jgi:hypothetical protein
MPNIALPPYPSWHADGARSYLEREKIRQGITSPVHGNDRETTGRLPDRGVNKVVFSRLGLLVIRPSIHHGRVDFAFREGAAATESIFRLDARRLPNGGRGGGSRRAWRRTGVRLSLAAIAIFDRPGSRS